jgi:hypothetical protein
MGNIRYTPTFQPADFADGTDLIRASGPNGFNARFHAIEDDLTQFSTVVGDVDTTLTAIASGPTEHSTWFPPQLSGLGGFTGWVPSATGGAQDALAGSASGGLVNLVLPDGVRLTFLRAIGQCSGVTLTIKLSRCAYGLNTVQTLATITTNGNPFDVPMPVDPLLARVDSGSFRYFLTATATSGPGTPPNVVFGAFQIGYSTADLPKPPATELSYSPAFHHNDWIDRVDPVEAAGPNGFNIRFQTIRSDLENVSTVVGQIATALRTTHRPSPGGVAPPTQLTFTPNLLPTRSAHVFTFSSTGVPVGTSLFSQSGGGGAVGIPATGVMNIAPPEGLRLTAVRLRGSIDGTGGSTTNRATLRLLRSSVANPTSSETLVTVQATGVGPFDVGATVPEDLGQVDIHLFRYVLRVDLEALSNGSSALAVESVQINAVASN